MITIAIIIAAAVVVVVAVIVNRATTQFIEEVRMDDHVPGRWPCFDAMLDHLNEQERIRRKMAGSQFFADEMKRVKAIRGAANWEEKSVAAFLSCLDFNEPFSPEYVAVRKLQLEEMEQTVVFQGREFKRVPSNRGECVGCDIFGLTAVPCVSGLAPCTSTTILKRVATINETSKT